MLSALIIFLIGSCIFVWGWPRTRIPYLCLLCSWDQKCASPCPAVWFFVVVLCFFETGYCYVASWPQICSLASASQVAGTTMHVTVPGLHNLFFLFFIFISLWFICSYREILIFLYSNLFSYGSFSMCVIFESLVLL
jgi:hypothetical protein